MRVAVERAALKNFVRVNVQHGSQHVSEIDKRRGRFLFRLAVHET